MEVVLLGVREAQQSLARIARGVARSSPSASARPRRRGSRTVTSGDELAIPLTPLGHKVVSEVRQVVQALLARLPQAMGTLCHQNGDFSIAQSSRGHARMLRWGLSTCAFAGVHGSVMRLLSSVTHSADAQLRAEAMRLPHNVSWSRTLLRDGVRDGPALRRAGNILLSVNR